MVVKENKKGYTGQRQAAAESHTDVGLSLRQYPTGLSQAWVIAHAQAEREDDKMHIWAQRCTSS